MDSADSTCYQEVWYAMRATYRRERQAQRLLEDAGIVSYIPMQTVEKVVTGRRRRVEVPAVHNLIFVRTTRDILRSFKERVPYLQYMMDRSRGEKNVPIVVPDKQMDDFMKVASLCGEKVEYLPVGDRKFLEGMRVRVLGGPLDGVEGVLVRSGKSRDRKLVVSLNGVVSVATASVGVDGLEII